MPAATERKSLGSHGLCEEEFRQGGAWDELGRRWLSALELGELGMNARGLEQRTQKAALVRAGRA